MLELETAGAAGSGALGNVKGKAAGGKATAFIKAKRACANVG